MYTSFLLIIFSSFSCLYTMENSNQNLANTSLKTTIHYQKKALFDAINAKNINQCKSLLTDKTLLTAKDYNNYSLLHKIATSKIPPSGRQIICQLFFENDTKISSNQEDDAIFDYILKEGEIIMISFFLQKKWCLPKNWRTLIAPHSFTPDYINLLENRYSLQRCDLCFFRTDALYCGMRPYPYLTNHTCDNCIEIIKKFTSAKKLTPDLSLKDRLYYQSQEKF